VGYVHFQKNKHLDFTLFLTAQTAIASIELSIETDDKLSVNIETNQIRNLLEGRQEAVKVSTYLTAFPYNMPTLKITVRDRNN